MDFEQQLGIKLSVLISGLVGGIISLTYEEKISAQRAVLLIVSGASTAAYLQPLAEHYLSFPENFSTGLGFVLGLTAMKILDFIIRNTEKFLKLKWKGNVDTELTDEQPSDIRVDTPVATRTARKKGQRRKA